MNLDIPQLVPAVVCVMLLVIAGAGCMEEASIEKAETNPTPTSEADDLLSQAEMAMGNSNYRTASSLYEEAYKFYTNSGDDTNALLARNGMFRATRAIIEYPHNRTAAGAAMQAAVPNLTETDMNAWLDGRAQTIESDGEVLYFGDVAANFLYANVAYLRPITATMLDFGYISRYAIPEGASPAGDGGVLPYIDPIRYTGTEKLEVPESVLPETGTLVIWYPLPLETESQRDVVVTNLSYKEYIVTGPVTEGRIAYVYYEIPAEAIDGDLLMTADIAFTSYEQRFTVDPVKVRAYDTTDPEYLLYTSSSRNIKVTDECRELAATIVGDETNPYLQAQLIYRYIINTYPYSFAPHASLDTIEPKVAESSYMLATGHGDCGTQSMFFSALCRSLGIPARAPGGYQMILAETPGTHFWAEYYIEGYGWVPCDTTVAEIADWVDIPEGDREAFKTYYANNLDPTRLVIQKDVDVRMNPAFPEGAVVFRLVRQSPAIVSDEATVDIGAFSGFHFTIDVEEEE
jgi:transglutaminase-like putative cysteine protease